MLSIILYTPSVSRTQFHKGRVVYSNEWFAVRECDLERNPAYRKYPVIERLDAVVVIPLTPSHKTILVKHFRFPTNENSWELPMGAIEQNEEAESAARRELFEEVGVRPRKLLKIGEYRPAPGLTPQKAHVFLANIEEKALALGPIEPQVEEINEVRAIPWNELVDMTNEGRITDGFSLSAFWLLNNWQVQNTEKT